MDNVSRFPFQTFEAINSHAYSLCGTLLHVKVMFIRYLKPEDRTEHFDCVIDCDGVHYFSDSNSKWRDGEDVPPVPVKGSELPTHEIDVPINDNLLSMKEIDVLQPGDRLVRNSSDAPVTVISTQKAPNVWRLKDDRSNNYFNVDRHGMTFYGWNRSLVSV